MGLLATIKGLFVSKSFAETEFGMDNMRFFVAVLRACPEGSRLTFHRSEPESFVQAFHEWSHREHAESFEADYYAIDRRLVELAERLAASGKLELDHHFAILAPDGRSLCDSLDDFTVVSLAEDIRKNIPHAQVGRCTR